MTVASDGPLVLERPGVAVKVAEARAAVVLGAAALAGSSEATARQSAGMRVRLE
jgi:hypothetical protein